MSNNKRAFNIILILIVGIVIGYALNYFMNNSKSEKISTSQTTVSEEDSLYTCGMHPQVIQKGPGICPICNMTLVPLKSAKSAPTTEKKVKYWVSSMDPKYISNQPGKDAMGMDLIPVYESELEASNAVTIDPSVVQNIGVRIEKVRYQAIDKVIRATGEVVVDETRVGSVNLKIAGWIEKVYVDQTGEKIAKGQPLVDIYSPPLVTTQEEYIVAMDNLDRIKNSPSESMIKSAQMTFESTRQRLKYWDISDAQIKELERTKQVKKTISLTSPFSGVVTEKMVLPGQKVEPGMELYQITDLSRIWVQVSVFDVDIPFIKIGEKAKMVINAIPGQEFIGKVTFISPVLNQMTRDLQVRLEFNNPNDIIKPGMYADVEISHPVDENALVIPSDAIIRSGERNLVFVQREPGRFIPTPVKLGVTDDNRMTQILDGLLADDEVVVSAQFLLDSESSLQEAVRKMLVQPEQATAQTTIKKGADPIEAAKIRQQDYFYGCPMPEHSMVISSATGKCPLCSMDLIKKDATYTCPMPEDGFFSDQAGKICDICGMHLISMDKAFPKKEMAKQIPQKKDDSMGNMDMKTETSDKMKEPIALGADIPIRNATRIDPDGTIHILCPVMLNEAEVDKNTSYTDYQGKRVYYCCPSCKKKFEADPEKFLANFDTLLKKAEYQSK
jgi:membrane fusion protein, copper/silver efflux system